MKKLLLTTIALAALVIPNLGTAGVNINIGIPLPPPIVFSAPPAVVALPDAYGVYVVPEIDVDIFFWNGWWWRPWEGRWYRSRYYDRGWAYFNRVPNFYFDIDPGWRGYYRDRRWDGHRWNYERVPYDRLNRNWRNWHENRYWERRGSWNVERYRPRPESERRELRRHRQEQYQRGPEGRHRER